MTEILSRGLLSRLLTLVHYRTLGKSRNANGLERRVKRNWSTRVYDLGQALKLGADVRIDALQLTRCKRAELSLAVGRPLLGAPRRNVVVHVCNDSTLRDTKRIHVHRRAHYVIREDQQSVVFTSVRRG